MGGSSAPGADYEFAEALREAIEARGLSLDRVRAHLVSYGHDVSIATLSYWQTGRSLPVRKASVQALGALEVVLRVPRGSLAAKLPTQRIRRRDTPPPLHRGPALRLGVAHAIADQLGLAWSDGFHRITQHDRLTVDADRRIATQVVSDLIVSDRDGFNRYLVGYSSDEVGVSLEIEPLEGCRVGRVIRDPRLTLTVAELILPQSLRAGEPWQVRHEVRTVGGARHVDAWRRVYLTRLREASVEVTFPSEDPPLHVGVYVGPDVEDAVYSPTELTSPSLLVHRSDHGPGTIAVRWDWDPLDPGPELMRVSDIHEASVPAAHPGAGSAKVNPEALLAGEAVPTPVGLPR